jgi:hypothetical protein
MSTDAGNLGENPLSEGDYKKVINRARKQLKPKVPIHSILTLTQKENNNKKEKTPFYGALTFSFSLYFAHIAPHTKACTTHSFYKELKSVNISLFSK